MLNWSIWNGTAAAWDACLLRFPDYSVYQTYGWGEHKRSTGWAPYRLAATRDGEPVAMAQVLARSGPLSTAFVWVPGGPVGMIEASGPPFRAAVVRAVSKLQVYCRINVMRLRSDADAEALRAAGWCEPAQPILSGRSILLDLAASDDAWLASIDKKHRYYVKKSGAAPIIWEYGNTEALRHDLAGLTHELSEQKGMNLQERDAEALRDLSLTMPGGVRILVGYLAGEPVTGCLVLTHGFKAYYATAATVAKGREISAAYSMFAKLRGLLRGEGMDVLDFGGIDPGSQRARGVDHFKGGFGGGEVRYLGEWEWARSRVMRAASAYMIRRRLRAFAG